MTMIDVQRLAAPRVSATYVDGTQGLAAGSRVLTLEGILPVEHVLPGDRIVTRRGSRVLKGIRRMELPRDTPVISLDATALGDRQERDLWLLPAQHVLLRDDEGHGGIGCAATVCPVEDLVDGKTILRSRAPAGAACLLLEFGQPEIVYADGLELASADQVSA